MRFIETKLSGVYVIELERLEDSRGFFARSFCARDFAQHGLHSEFVQCNVSYNSGRGTIRGMHFQRSPAAETKLVRCTRGTIHDVVVDLREDSATFRQHLAVTLSAEERNALYIPERFAHGFQTLEDDTEVFYQMGDYYTPGDAAGLRIPRMRFLAGGRFRWVGRAPALRWGSALWQRRGPGEPIAHGPMVSADRSDRDRRSRSTRPRSVCHRWRRIGSR